MADNRWTRRELGAMETRSPSTYDRRYFETKPLVAHVPSVLAARRQLLGAISMADGERDPMKRAKAVLDFGNSLLDDLVPARERVSEAMRHEAAVRERRPAPPPPARSADERLTAARAALGKKE